MRQQVNLYQSVFRQRAPIFSARALALAALLLVAALGTMHGHAVRQVSVLQSHVEGLEDRRAVAQTRLLALREKLPPEEPGLLLAAELGRLTGELSQLEALVAALAAEAGAAGRGFSAHLAGLARQRVEGLWLTGIHIDDAGREVVIRGSALDAARVPVLVQRLGDEPAFAGMHFATLGIERAPAGAAHVDFVLRTHRAQPEADRGD